MQTWLKAASYVCKGLLSRGQESAKKVFVSTALWICNCRKVSNVPPAPPSLSPAEPEKTPHKCFRIAFWRRNSLVTTPSFPSFPCDIDGSSPSPSSLTTQV
jgi:hypothetical protein